MACRSNWAWLRWPGYRWPWLPAVEHCGLATGPHEVQRRGRARRHPRSPRSRLLAGRPAAGPACSPCRCRRACGGRAGLQSLLTYPWQVLALAGLPLAFLAGSVIRAGQAAGRPCPPGPGWWPWSSWPAIPTWRPASPRSIPAPSRWPCFQADGGRRAPDHAPRHRDRAAHRDHAHPDPDPDLAGRGAGGRQTIPSLSTSWPPDDAKVAQRDTRPCDGECPTDTWQPGEIIVDRYELALPRCTAG